MAGDVRIAGKPVAYLSGEMHTEVVRHNVKLPVDVLGNDRLHQRKLL